MGVVPESLLATGAQAQDRPTDMQHARTQIFPTSHGAERALRRAARTSLCASCTYGEDGAVPLFLLVTERPAVLLTLLSSEQAESLSHRSQRLRWE